MSYVIGEIFEAVADGDAEHVQLLLQQLCQEEAVSQLGERDGYGRNIVFRAVGSGNAEILDLLLKKLGDSAKDLILEEENGWSAVLIAVLSRNVEAVELLFMALKQEIKDVIIPKDIQVEENLLHFASRFSSVEVLKAVLNRLGSSEEQVQAIAMKNECGQTVLHVAARCGNEDIFNLLADTVQLGAQDGAEMFKLKDGDGESLLLGAARGRTFNIFKRVWEESGDDVSLHAVQENVEVLFFALAGEQMTEERNAWFVKKVALLLDHLGDKAEDFICSTWFVKKVAFQLYHLGDKAEDFICSTVPRRTLLHAAAKGRYKDIVKILLDRLGEFSRFEILRKDEERRTVIHEAAAAKRNNVDIFKLLVDKVSINRKALMEDEDVSGKTVLHLAAESSQSTGILEIILEQLGSEVHSSRQKSFFVIDM